MSRRYLPSSSSQHPFISHYSSDNTYQVTTLPQPHTYLNPLNTKDYYDASGTCTDASSYHNSYDYQHIKESKTRDCMFSEVDDSSVKYYHSDEGVNNRFSARQNSVNHKNPRKVYPIPDRKPTNSTTTGTSSLPHRLAVSQLSDRPKSSLSATSARIVDGCGGHCQTFENVCYYFLQVAFTMGILIGISLSIAGAVLRKSAARNLQVLVYIGVMLSLVSFVLLYIQCTARYAARKRKKFVRQTIRDPIPLVTLQTVHNQPPRTVIVQQQPLMDLNSSKRRYDKYSKEHGAPAQLDQQGIPWWRRKEPHC